MRHSFGLAALVLLATTSYPRTSGACLPFPNNAGPWSLDERYATDATPPGAVTATASVARFAATDTGGCGGDGELSDCGGGASARIELELAAVDDRSGTDVGYRFLVVGGQPPEGFRLGASGDEVLRPNDASSYVAIAFPFSYDARAFSFDLEIRAVDLNGNEGAPVVITIDG